MIDAILFDKNQQQIKILETHEVAEAIQNPDNLLWIDMEFPPEIWPDSEIIDVMQNVLNIHHLNIEDCVFYRQHPKIEDFQEYLFFIAYSLKLTDKESIKLDEIDIVVGKNFVLTYRHSFLEEVDAVKTAFKSKINHMHQSSSMLFYSISDHLIDGYQHVMDNFDIKIDKTGNKLFKEPNNSKILLTLNSTKELLTEIRSIVVAEENIFLNASKGLYSIIKEEENILFRDIYDHSYKILDRIDKYSNTISNLFILQMNLSTQKLNELVKFLTIISALLLPANLVSGIFGMNFEKIPLLQNSLGFYISICAMLFSAVCMIILFVRKKWL